MEKLLPHALFLGLVSILGHVAFITLGDLGKDVGIVPWIKILLVFGVAWLLQTSTNLTQRYNSPAWVWMAFGAIGALGTLLVLTELGSFAARVIFILLVPLIAVKLIVLLPYLQLGMVFLLLMIVHELRGREGARA